MFLFLLSFFSHIILDIKFANISPSLRAAACVALVRLIFKIEPIWSPYLEQLTHYSHAQIAPIISCMYELYLIKRKIQHLPNTLSSQTQHYSTLINEENQLSSDFNASATTETADTTANNSTDASVSTDSGISIIEPQDNTQNKSFSVVETPL